MLQIFVNVCSVYALNGLGMSSRTFHKTQSCQRNDVIISSFILMIFITLTSVNESVYRNPISH